MATQATEPAAELYSAGRRNMLLFDDEGYREAVPMFLRALELSPGDAVVRSALAETYSFWGSRREKSGRECLNCHELAHREARRALELAPELSEAHRAMGLALRAGAGEDMQASLREVQLAYELNPYDGENCWALWKAGGQGPDEPMIHKAIALLPSLCGAHNDLGACLCERGRLEEACFHLRRALQINPRNSLVQYNLAMVESRRGGLDEARAILDNAARMHPGDALILSGLELLKDEPPAGPEAP